MPICSYNGNALIPAPLVNIERVVSRTAEGTARQHLWNISIDGEIVVWKGSPQADGSWWTQSGYPPDTNPSLVSETTNLDIIKKKIKAIQEAFDKDGIFIIQPQNGAAPIKIQLLVDNVQFIEGRWNKVVQYKITGKSQNIIFGTATGTDPGSQDQTNNPPLESWILNQEDTAGRIFKLTHTVTSSAQKRINDDGSIIAEGWEVARDLILGGSLAGTGAVSKLGFQSQFLIAANVVNLNNFAPYNYIRGEQIDQGNGSVTITETWTCIDPTVASPTGQTAGHAIEELNIDSRFSIEDGLNSVTLNGTVTGMEDRDPTTRALITSYWDNGNARFATLSNSVIFNLAQTLTGFTLNPAPISITVAKNRVTGVIQWSQTYNNRIGVSNFGYLTEIIEITFNNAADVFASIPVIARPAGPILQPIGSTTQKAATINIAITVPTQYGFIPAIPTTNPLSIFTSFVGLPAQVFLANDQVNWNYKQGRYTRSSTFVYQ